MNTTVLRECANVILECSIEHYLPLKNLNAKLLYPFRVELEENLVPLETQTSRENVMYYYISQFDLHTIKVNDICYNFLTPEEKSVKIVNSFCELEEQIPGINQAKINHYIIHYFLNQIFDYMQMACMYYGVNFRKLCKELRFPINCIDYFPVFTIKEEYLPKIEKIFEHYNTLVFNCNYNVFCQGIRKADFRSINIKTKTKVQDLTFRLSGIMVEDWYDEVCKTMKWNKSVCSGQGTKFIDNREMKILDKIIPRPGKK